MLMVGRAVEVRGGFGGRLSKANELIDGRFPGLVGGRGGGVSTVRSRKRAFLDIHDLSDGARAAT